MCIDKKHIIELPTLDKTLKFLIDNVLSVKKSKIYMD